MTVDLRCISRFGLLAVAALVVTGSAVAQTVIEPSLTAFAGEGRDPGSAPGENDQYFGLEFRLPVQRSSELVDVDFLLEVSKQEGQDTTRLDSDDILLSTNVARRVSPRGTFEFGLDVTQEQQRPKQLTAVLNPTIRRRLETRYGQLRLGHTTRFSERRWFEIRASHNASQFRSLDPGQNAASLADLAEDRSLSTAELLFGFDSSSRWSVRPGYRFSLFDFDLSGRDTSHEALLDFRRQVADRSYFELQVGGYLYSNEETGDETTGPSGLLRFSQLFAHNSWDVQLSRGLDASDPFLGVNEASEAIVSWSVLSRYFDSGLSLGVARRDPLESVTANEPLESFLVGASMGFALGPYFGLRIDYSYSEGLSGIVESLDYSRINVGLTWYPNKNQRFGSLGRIEDSPAGRSRRARRYDGDSGDSTRDKKRP